MTMDTRWEDVDQLLDRTERTTDEKHVKAVQEIAKARYVFPTPEHPAYRTYVNHPEVTMGVQVGREELAPDIVVVEKHKTGEMNAVIAVAVASREQVNEAEAKRTWARYASIEDVAFYLYVPVGYGAEAKKVCRKQGIDVTGFRTYRDTPRGFEVNEVSESPSPLAALMPPFVRKLLATP